MESTSGMSREAVIILRVAIGALLCGAWFVYWIIKDGLPVWSYWVTLGFVLFFSVLVAKSFLPAAEEKLAERLSHDGRAGHAVGMVVELQRSATKETTTTRQTRLSLKLLLSGVDGGARIVDVNVWVEDALMLNFASGKTVHVLLDPDDPSRVAVDRSQTPIMVQ